VTRAVGRRPLIVPAPVAFHRLLAVVAEATMTIPLALPVWRWMALSAPTSTMRRRAVALQACMLSRERGGASGVTAARRVATSHQ